ncbi:MAG: TonB-dependent receptor, partial [Bacteroides sp.]
SRVNFPAGSRNENRPMQGQSPYLINTGLFYKNERQQLNITLLYNRIGKRIIGVGRSEGSSGSEDNARVPDSYEMPRDVFDLTLSKRFGEHLEIKANVRDLLAQKVSYKQFAEVPSANGTTHEVEQITRQYKPGRNFGLSATYSF